MLKPNPATNVTSLIDAIQSYHDVAGTTKWLVQPLVNLSSDSTAAENADEVMTLTLTLKQMLIFTSCWTQLSPRYGFLTHQTSPRRLRHSHNHMPTILNSIPPFVYHFIYRRSSSLLRSLNWMVFLQNRTKNQRQGSANGRSITSVSSIKTCAASVSTLTTRSHVRCQVTPDPNTPVGYAIRSTLVDIIDIFEVNRKECARLLLEYPKWTLPGTFKPKPGTSTEADPLPGKDWQLESTIIEVRLQFHDVPQANDTHRMTGHPWIAFRPS